MPLGFCGIGPWSLDVLGEETFARAYDERIMNTSNNPRSDFASAPEHTTSRLVGHGPPKLLFYHILLHYTLRTLPSWLSFKFQVPKLDHHISA